MKQESDCYQVMVSKLKAPREFCVECGRSSRLCKMRKQSCYNEQAAPSNDVDINCGGTAFLACRLINVRPPTEKHAPSCDATMNRRIQPTSWPPSRSVVYNSDGDVESEFAVTTRNFQIAREASQLANETAWNGTSNCVTAHLRHNQQ